MTSIGTKVFGMKVFGTLCLTLLLALPASDAWAKKKKKEHHKSHPSKATPAKAAEKAPDPKAAPSKKGPAPVEAPVARPSTPAGAPQEVVKRESKIEFDDRLVQGQRAAGAVYLFQRAESQFTSLVQTPDSFRQRTIGSVFGDGQ